MKFITEKTLPIPFFVRGDDVEFSIRNKARIISLNGICVWHMGFGEKFSAQMEYYQVMRNSLILQAFHPHCAKINFAPRCNTLFTSLIEEFSYDYAELILDAVEDFLSGHSIISKPNGLEVIKEKGKKNETLRPLSEVWSGTVDFTKVFNYDRLKYPDSVLRRKMVTFSHNGQGKLQKLVSSDMGFTSYDWEFVQQTVFMKKRGLVVNPYEATGAIHERDPQRYEELVARRDRVFERYNAEHESIERAYREAYPRLTSLEFWTEYLNLDK